ncbi:hypothetical protein ACFLT9_06100 [Acidobacteriota bacterium]
MSLKKIITITGSIFVCLSLLCSAPRQESRQGVQKKAAEPEAAAEKQIPPKKLITYNSAGRRDPFKDLLGGAEASDSDLPEGIGQIAIDDVVLSGILRVRGTLTAIIKDPQGFPTYIKEGDQFLDGYVLTIKPLFVIFRKTKERGMPLLNPKDIVKQLFDEVR